MAKTRIRTYQNISRLIRGNFSYNSLDSLHIWLLFGFRNFFPCGLMQDLYCNLGWAEIKNRVSMIYTLSQFWRVHCFLLLLRWYLGYKTKYVPRKPENEFRQFVLNTKIVLKENIYKCLKLFFDPWKFFWILFNCDQFMVWKQLKRN